MMKKTSDEIYDRLPAALLPWYGETARPLPWRRDREPYHVWLSEIMLQQTRAEVVAGYFLRFLEALPTVFDLAAVSDEALLKLWEGLGYYSRARNLKKSAEIIVRDCGGRFPETYDELLALPGVGPYTAGAVASICFDQPVAAVDGNVLRVITRATGDNGCIDDPAVKKRIGKALTAVYPKGACGDFTQGLMELGATVCPPNTAPKCELCPLGDFCRSRADGWRGCPVRKEKRDRRVEKRTVFVLRAGERLAIRKRAARGLLAGLWELPNVLGDLDDRAALEQAAAWSVEPVTLEKSVRQDHVFTHVRWEMVCYHFTCRGISSEFEWVGEAALEQDVALPTAFRKFL